MKDFCYYLVRLQKKKPDKIIIYFNASNAPYKNEDKIYKKLKCIKVEDFINK